MSWLKAQRYWAVGVSALAIIGLYVGFGWIAQEDFRKEHSKFFQVKRGMRDVEVRLLLGDPLLMHEANTAPENYYVSGYEWKERPISHRVIIYMEKDGICYVYINRDGHVEDVFVGGS
jgi:hypothetical protein